MSIPGDLSLGLFFPHGDTHAVQSGDDRQGDGKEVVPAAMSVLDGQASTPEVADVVAVWLEAW